MNDPYSVFQALVRGMGSPHFVAVALVASGEPSNSDPPGQPIRARSMIYGEETSTADEGELEVKIPILADFEMDQMSLAGSTINSGVRALRLALNEDPIFDSAQGIPLGSFKEDGLAGCVKGRKGKPGDVLTLRARFNMSGARVCLVVIGDRLS